MSTILSFDSKLGLFKPEVTYGTDSSPAAANAIQMINGQIEILGDELRREIDQPFMGNKASLLIGRRTRVSFDFEFTGAGSGNEDTAIPNSPLLLASAHAETINAATDVTYNPISSGFDSLSSYWWLNEHRYVMVGARATSFSINGQVDNYLKGSITLEGIFADPTEVAQVTPDYSAYTQGPVVIDENSTSITLDSYEVNATQITMNAGIESQNYRGTDSSCIAVTGRGATGEITIFDPTIGVKNYFSVATNRTQVALAAAFGTASGRIVELNSSQVQLGAPRETDINGAHGLILPYSFLPSSSGNDDYELVTK